MNFRIVSDGPFRRVKDRVEDEQETYVISPVEFGSSGQQSPQAIAQSDPDSPESSTTPTEESWWKQFVPVAVSD